MSALKAFFGELRKDASGASFLEYTVLLGILLVGSIGILGGISGYANTIWEGVHGVMATVVSSM